MGETRKKQRFRDNSKQKRAINYAMFLSGIVDNEGIIPKLLSNNKLHIQQRWKYELRSMSLIWDECENEQIHQIKWGNSNMYMALWE